MATNIPSVHETYAYEAQKRLRTDGLLQFQDVQQSASARIRHLAHDAWADEECLSATEPASTCAKRTKFLIMGARVGGIVSAVRLILARFSTDQIRLGEAAGGAGGTWYWNRFPGLHCDVESYVYMPLLEEMDYMPSQKYASGVEIRHYLQKVVEKYQLHHRIILGTKVDSLRWEEQDCVWKAELSSSHDPVLTRYEPPVNAWAAEAEFVILTAGYLARPQVPTLDGAGVDSFQGDMFHTARWDYGVTGGSSEDVFPQLEKLRDKKVGIIGTGATAIQVIRCLAKHAKEVSVFQRTPSAVYSRGQQGTDTKEWRDKIASAEGWHRDRMENMTARMSRSASSGLADLVNDE
ncbi:Flavin monooxygenase-like protein [Akanthomyces lecanii RCEF 1005]|uniref:Flavin monooxygenase-like protein n=1 Tax=Akanthomyces lecanii RCEF 1005 TaxID=1081108 RepID=A0A162N295_CORDF|nr:Flavin monooxygenase-like protein [Akanthomyces lecanii RCEF 1005]